MTHLQYEWMEEEAEIWERKKGIKTAEKSDAMLKTWKTGLSNGVKTKQ